MFHFTNYIYIFLINSINMENLRDVDPIASGLPTFILFILVALLIYTLIKEVVKYKKNKEKQSIMRYLLNQRSL
ncbi:hypothetical protein J4710_02490 [Staphylococcus xylosus]|uniref:Uncharacterized protein n=1 Tax=Staphylococcus xylosus TaxID=1288 RepID=A0A939NDJ1_STAXY|nr:hypothetical protein [Staphylococcus xylosus]